MQSADCLERVSTPPTAIGGLPGAGQHAAKLQLADWLGGSGRRQMQLAD
jgi:hypothetical protein